MEETALPRRAAVANTRRTQSVDGEVDVASSGAGFCEGPEIGARPICFLVFSTVFLFVTVGAAGHYTAVVYSALAFWFVANGTIFLRFGCKIGPQGTSSARWTNSTTTTMEVVRTSSLTYFSFSHPVTMEVEADIAEGKRANDVIQLQGEWQQRDNKQHGNDDNDGDVRGGEQCPGDRKSVQEAGRSRNNGDGCSNGRGWGTDTACVICLGDYANGDLLCRLPCRHVFHATCTNEWLDRSNRRTCPLCKASLPGPALGVVDDRSAEGEDGDRGAQASVAEQFTDRV